MLHTPVEISIIIPCYNDGLFLKETLQSIQEQTYQNFEIIIIDDASTDNETHTILTELNQKNLQIIRLEKNSGPAVARNRGISLAQGKYILPVDADDKIAPTYLEKAKQILDTNQDIGIVYCQAEFFGTLSGQWQLPKYSFPEILISNMIFATAMYRRSDWSLVGGYNEKMIYGYEDYDFWISLIKHNKKVHQLNEILFFYRIKDNSRSTKLLEDDKIFKTFQQMYQNHEKLYNNHTQYLLESVIKYEQQANLLINQIEFKKTIISDKDQHITDLTTTHRKNLHDKDTHITNLQKHIATLETHITTLDTHIQQQENTLKELYMIIDSMRIKSRIKRLIKKIAPAPLWKVLSYSKQKIQMLKALPNTPTTSYVYQQPILTDTIKQEILDFSTSPLISIIMPVYNVDPKWLKLAIKSIKAQWYPNWELCIADDKSDNLKTIRYLKKLKDPKIKIIHLEENLNISGASNAALKLSTGEYILLMDNDDELTHDALYEVIKAINSGAEFIYSDEDKLEMDGTHSDPHFKADFAPDLFLSQNYLSHLGVIKKSLITQVSGFTLGLEGSQDYDLYLKVLEHTKKIQHIPKVLYHWRKVPGSTAAEYGEKSYAQEAGRKALENAMSRRNIPSIVKNGQTPGTYKIDYTLTETPLVSIVIPFKDKPELLKMCIESILKSSTYQNFEIIGISNNSSDAITFQTMENLKSSDQRISFYEYNIPFNYSKINNYAVTQYAKGEHILFLNNDIEIITPTWIEELLMYSQQKDTGAIGAKLYFPNDTIQHAGIVLVPKTIHATILMYQEYPRNHYGYVSRLRCVNNYSAVTAACLMIKRNLFNEIGQFDEKKHSIAYNDVDLCLKLQESGYRNIWTPYCEAYHYESVSRGYEVKVDDVERREKEKWYLKEKYPKIFTQGDPHYNPNLTRFGVGSELSPLVTTRQDIVKGKPFSETIHFSQRIKEKKYSVLSIFSHYDTEDEIKEDVIYYLKSLAKFTDITFVSTSENLSQTSLEIITSYCSNIIVKKNNGYDFGAWKSGLTMIGDMLYEYDTLILCNDSVYGPLFDLETIYTSMQAYDIWSMTDNYEIEYHLQSYFMVYTKKAFSHPTFQDFWENFKIYEDKQTLIEHNELGFSQKMMQTGLTYNSYYSVKNKNYVNVLQYHWDTLIKEYQFPFIKKELLQRNPLNISIESYQDIIDTYSHYDSGIIEKQINKLKK